MQCKGSVIRHAGASAASRSPVLSRPIRPFVAGRQCTLAVRATGEGDGVLDLLSRDRKAPKLAPELLEDATFGSTTSEQPASTASSSSTTSTSSSTPSSSSSRAQARSAVKSKRDRRLDMAKAADSGSEGGQAANRPKRCKDAIDAGLALFAAGDYPGAIGMFNEALELTGNGAYRLPGSPREYSCPSDAEENACLYNMACCYAQLGQRDAALTCIDAILDNGFTDVETLKSDPDLAPVRGRELQELIDKYTGLQSKLKQLLPFGNKKQPELVSDSNKNKPWIMW